MTSKGITDHLVAWSDGDVSSLSPLMDLSEIVAMRYFGGMKKEEVAEVLGISSATVSRRWRTARTSDRRACVPASR